MGKKCKQYLLKKVLVRLDFDQAQDIDVDNAIQKVRNKFFEKEYKLYQNVVPLTSLQAENIIPMNNEINNLSSVNIINETVREYQLRKERQVIKFSNKYLIIEDLIDNDYKGEEFYSDIIQILMQAIYEINPYITLQRIGLRKFDSLVFKEINNINKYFDTKIFNQNDFMLKYKDFNSAFLDANSKISICLFEKNCKANIITDIQTGEYVEELGNSGQAVQAVLDIDIYREYFEKSDSLVEDILKIYETLSTESYGIYKSALTEKFYDDLLNGTVNDTDILGGIFGV